MLIRLLLFVTLLLNSLLIHAQTLEICDNGLDDDADGYVDCYDADCLCANPPDCAIPLPNSTDLSIQLAWETSAEMNVWSNTTMVGNMNPQTESIPEILVTYSNGSSTNFAIRFYRGDGSNAGNPDELMLQQGFYHSIPPLIGDIDNDGRPELIITETDRRIRVYRNFTPGASPAMSLWMQSIDMTERVTSQAMLADLNGDGTPEIIAGNEIFIFDFTGPAAPTLRKILDGGNGPAGVATYDALSNPHALCSPAVADLLTPADCNGDPDCNGLELAAGPIIYSIDLDSTDGDGVELKIMRDLNQMNLSDEFRDGVTAIADMNIDGIPDMVTFAKVRIGADPLQYGLYVWNKNGLIQFMPVPFNPLFSHPNGLITIANVFDDKKRGLAKDYPEVVVFKDEYLYAFNLHATNIPNSKAWWFQYIPAYLTDSQSQAASTFDFNGDGISEIVIIDNDELRIICGDHMFPPIPGVDAERNWAVYPVENNYGEIQQYPVVVDVDNDGQAEIAVVAGDSLSANSALSVGSLKVFETAGLAWPACRNVWNQYNYNIVNVDDDLGIPVVPQQQWKEFPAPGSGKRPLNMALSQRGPLSGTAYLPLANLHAMVDTFFCDQNGLRLRLNVCNEGSAASPAGLSLQWYLGDPTMVGAVKYGPPSTFAAAIYVDSCAHWDLSIPLPPNGTLFGIVNDNGSLATPINLAADFPSTNLQECDYLDNILSVTVSYTTPTLDLGPDQSVCKDANVLLSAGSGFAQYRWQDGSQNSTFTTPGSGKYWVDAWDICGNLFSDTLELHAIPTPVLDLGPDRAVCTGDSITLIINGFDNVDWTSSAGTLCAGCPVLAILPAADLTIWAAGQSGACFERDTLSIQVLPVPGLSGQADATSCGNQNGILNVAVNSTSGYQVQWSGGQSGLSLTGLSAGAYTVTVTDAGGCSTSETFQVAGSTALTLDPPVLSQVSCFAGQNGMISLNVGSGTAPYGYNWSSGPGGAVLSGLVAGNYALTVTDAQNCSLVAAFQITEPPALSIQSTVDGTSCISPTGSIVLSGQGGTAPYSFAWNTGQNTPALSDLSPGSYTATLTDANGCSTSETYSFGPGGTPVLDAVQIVPVACFGENTGQISLQPGGGQAPYQFNWSTGPGTAVLDNLTAGDYSLTLSDANGCSLTTQFAVNGPPELLLQVSMDSTSCIRLNADINISPQGGTPPYVYSWSGGQNTATLNDLPPGTYTVSVTDGNACSVQQNFDIQPGGSPQVSNIELTPVRCSGENNGQISVAVSDGLAPYQFDWSSGPGANSLSGLSAGSYALTTTDANGCSATALFTVSEPPPLMLSGTVDSTSCTSNTGNIAAVAQGGTAPYTFIWNSGQNTAGLSGILPGIYILTATDAQGCTNSQSFTIEPGGAPVLTNTILVPVRCAGEMNGAISTDVSGGIAPYHLLWSTGASGVVLNNLPAGDYLLTATDANGCSTVQQFSLTEPMHLTYLATVDSTSCTSNTGNISLNPQGGSSPYTFSWSNGQSTMALSDLMPGAYSVTVSDAHDCVSSGSFTILPGGAPVLAATVMPVACFGENTGQISVDIVGGIGPYQFNWTTGPDDASLTDLPAGVYGLTVSDANSCTDAALFILEEAPPLEIIPFVSADTCGQSTGAVAIQTGGGVAPYTFLWSGGQQTEDLPYVVAGSWQLTVTDAMGCTALQSVEVLFVVVEPAFTLSGDTITCLQPVVPAFAVPAPTYWSFQWQGPGGSILSGPAQNLIQGGAYSVTATNELGCSATQTLFVVTDTLAPQAVSATDELFIPCDLPAVQLDGSASSAGPFFTAQWFRTDNGQVLWDTLSRSAETSDPGIYILQLTDSRNGCFDRDTVTVTAAERIEAVLVEIDSVSCFGLENGVIRVLDVQGGQEPYVYALNGQNFGQDPEFTTLPAGDHIVSVRDLNGCIWQSPLLVITEPAPLALALSASDTLIDFGETVLLQAMVQPPDAVLNEIQWSPSGLFTVPDALVQNVRPTEPTFFQVQVEDIHGCQASAETWVRVRREAVYLPNVFDPDRPDNNAFTVFAGADVLDVKELQVYDRWGEQLFKRTHFAPNDPALGWDGSFRGKRVNPGVYVYYVVVELKDGRVLTFSGSVTMAQ